MNIIFVKVNIKTDDVTKIDEVAYKELWKNRRVESIPFSRIIEECGIDEI